MSPSKDDISAFAVYSSKKNKGKRNRKSKTKTVKSVDMFTAEREESDVEEILNDRDEPNASNSLNNVRDKKKKYSNMSFTVTNEETRTSGVEIIDIDENSNDVLPIESAAKGKKRKVIVLNPENEGEEEEVEEEDEEIIFEDIIGRKMNGMQSKRKSTKGKKKKRDSLLSENSSVSSDIFIVEEEESAEEDNYSGNSLVEGKKLFGWLINPVDPEEFFK
jgi:hypothetical protein